MQWAVLPLDATKCYPRGLYASWNTNSKDIYSLFYITFSYVPHHFCVVIFVLSHSSRSSRKVGVAAAQRGCTCTVLVICLSKTNNKLKVFDTCIAIPTCTALDCCYSWLCFTTWICVFYVLTSGCVYSIWPVLISPSVYAFSASPLNNKSWVKTATYSTWN